MDEELPYQAELCSIMGDVHIGWIKYKTDICGEDFCDACGDCLYCYGDGYCPNGYHRRIVYWDGVMRFLAEHPYSKIEWE